MNQTKNSPYYKTCEEQPSDCIFRFAEYSQGETFDHGYEDAHYIVYCSRGVTRLQSNLFKEEFIYAGEVLFLPRMADCRGEVLDNSHAIIHTFNNSVCTPENCILSYLYKHNRRNKSTEYRCKLSSHKALNIFMDGIAHYLTDGTETPQLWRMKHQELIHLLCRYYQPEELQSFFHPMIGENVPFRSLVMAHYRKANQSKQLAELCGYGEDAFCRKFKQEFGTTVYQWLIAKRAEHIRHRLSSPHIPLVDIIDEFNFSSSAHLSHFYKKYLGDTPTNLRESSRLSNP